MEVCQPILIIRHGLTHFTHASFRILQAPSSLNPKLQASLLRVAMMVARELQDNIKEKFYTEV